MDVEKVISKTIVLLLMPLVLMLVWNAVMPGIFGLASLGYWSSMGLYVVCGILIKK